MNKYKTAYLFGFQNALEYRTNYIINLISIFFPIMMQYFVWNAVYGGKPADTQIFDFTYSQMMVYTLSSGFIAKLISTGFHYQISDDIKSGNLSQFLVKPIRYYLFRATRFFGEKTSEFLLIFLLMLFFLLILSPILQIQITFSSICMLLAAMIPALVLNFMLFFCVSLIAFWVLEVGRLYGIIDIMIAIVSGSIFPLTIFGDKAVKILQILPFPYTTYFLTNILSGKVDLSQFVQGLGMQFLWIAILCSACILLWRRGLKRYAATGG